MKVNGDSILCVAGSDYPGEELLPCAPKLVSIDNKRLAAGARGCARHAPPVGSNTQSFDQEDQ